MIVINDYDCGYTQFYGNGLCDDMFFEELPYMGEQPVAVHYWSNPSREDCEELMREFGLEMLYDIRREGDCESNAFAVNQGDCVEVQWGNGLVFEYLCEQDYWDNYKGEVDGCIRVENECMTADLRDALARNDYPVQIVLRQIA